MKVDLLEATMVNSDLGVVNAARCSFDKESKLQVVHNSQGSIEGCLWTAKKNKGFPCDTESHYIYKLSQQDSKLISYLAQHQHWTPFAHAQEVFKLGITDRELLEFLLRANLSGFEWIDTSPWLVRGSLYAWLTNLKHLPRDIAADIWFVLREIYPISVDVLTENNEYEPEDHASIIRTFHITNPTAENLKALTLRIHCPIFVKRQLETHRRNFVMTDIEDFSQNEVSRRYIDTEPELYTPQTWRIQSTNKKQGSSEETLQSVDGYIVNANYAHHTHNSLLYYQQFNNLQIAHEQSRMVLPLSTYTTFWFTGSLKSWKRLLALRLDTHAQSETQELAHMIYKVLKQDRVEL